LGEVEEISSESLKMVENSLLKVFTSNNVDLIRRKALESLGFSSRKDVIKFIRDAYDSENVEWRSSALTAMARSADNRWNQYVIDSLEEPDEQIRVEAIRAVGDLEIHAARLMLFDILEEYDSYDADIFSATIWSLSQIGGGNTGQALESLLEISENVDEIEFLESALENLRLTDGFQKSYETLFFDVQDETEPFANDAWSDDNEIEDEDIY
jgi:HEAT repeat protein